MPADILAAQEAGDGSYRAAARSMPQERELGSGRQADCRQALISKTMNIPPSNRKAFTLVEIIIVVPNYCIARRHRCAWIHMRVQVLPG